MRECQRNRRLAALYDDEVNHVIGVDGAAASVIYTTVVGYPATR
jgi:hypothetical protein